MTSALADDFRDVVARWNPSGLAHVRAVKHTAIHVVGFAEQDVLSKLDAVAALTPPGTALLYTSSAAEAVLALMMVDAASPIGDAELRAIRDVSERIPVLVLLTKIDAYRNWQQVVRRDADLLGEHLPHALDVSIWPVSAAGAGVAAVVSRLRELCADTHDEPRRYRAAVVNVAAQARRALVDRAREVADGRESRALRGERATIAATRDASRSEQATALRSGIQLAKVDLTHAVGDELRQVGSVARTMIDGMGTPELQQFPDQFAVLMAAAAGRIDELVHLRIRTIHQDVVRSDPAEVHGKSPPAVVTALAPPMGARRRGIEDRMMILVGASAGVSAGRLAVSPLAMVPALDIATIPLTFVLGGLFAWWLTRARGLAASRNHLRAWVNEGTVHAKSALEQRVLADILEAETRIGGLLDAAAHASNMVREQSLVRIDDELRALAETRSQFLASCDRDLVVLDRGLELAKRVEPIGDRVRPTQ